MKVSFDFDATLSRHDVQVYASNLVDEGHEVWIVTSRWDFDNLDKRWKSKKDGEPWRHQDLFQVAEWCGIGKERIHFTNQVKKVKFLEDNDFIFHVDDEFSELIEIMKNGKVESINVDYFAWEHECHDIINKRK